MPILGSSNSAANKDMMSNILTNGDILFILFIYTIFKEGNIYIQPVYQVAL